MNNNYLPIFTFRGLLFREYKHGIGLQISHPKTSKWFDTAVLNRRLLERDYLEVPDIAMWSNREYLGTIQF